MALHRKGARGCARRDSFVNLHDKSAFHRARNPAQLPQTPRAEKDKQGRT
jgi:hypothetical protein